MTRTIPLPSLQALSPASSPLAARTPRLLLGITLGKLANVTPATAAVEQVYWRRHWRYHHRRHWRRWWW